MPIGFFVTAINLGDVDSAAVTVEFLKDRFPKKPRPYIHKRRIQDVAVKESWVIQWYVPRQKSPTAFC